MNDDFLSEFDPTEEWLAEYGDEMENCIAAIMEYEDHCPKGMKWPANDR